MKSSNGSIGRRSNLSTLGLGARGLDRRGRARGGGQGLRGLAGGRGCVGGGDGGGCVRKVKYNISGFDFDFAERQNTKIVLRFSKISKYIKIHQNTFFDLK